eukprot:4042-Heterococcus_DN1.PRE.1
MNRGVFAKYSRTVLQSRPSAKSCLAYLLIHLSVAQSAALASASSCAHSVHAVAAVIRAAPPGLGLSGESLGHLIPLLLPLCRHYRPESTHTHSRVLLSVSDCYHCQLLLALATAAAAACMLAVQSLNNYVSFNTSRALGLDLLLELAQRATPTGTSNHLSTDPQAHQHVWCAAVLMVFVAVRAYLELEWHRALITESVITETLATSDHAHITSLALALTAAVVSSAPRAQREAHYSATRTLCTSAVYSKLCVCRAASSAAAPCAQAVPRCHCSTVAHSACSMTQLSTLQAPCELLRNLLHIAYVLSCAYIMCYCCCCLRVLQAGAVAVPALRAALQK